MKKLLLLVLASLALPVAAFAGGDLTWKECVGSAGALNNQVFNCTGTTNINYVLIVQFKSPTGLANAVAVTAIVDLETDQGAVPLSPFWRYDAGACQRPGAIQGVAMFDNIALVPTCDPVGGTGSDLDLWDGDGSGGTEGIGAYGADFPTPGRGRFVLIDARTTPTGLVPSPANYYAFHLTFNNRHRSDCAGCTQKAALVLNKIIIESNDGTPPLELTGPDKKSNCATINGGGQALCDATPARNTTWGQLKAIYR